MLQWLSALASPGAGALPAELLPLQPDVWRMHPVRRKPAVLCRLPPDLRCQGGTQNGRASSHHQATDSQSLFGILKTVVHYALGPTRRNVMVTNTLLLESPKTL